MNQDIQADEVEYGTPKHDNPNQFIPSFILGLMVGMFIMLAFVPALLLNCKV